MIAALIFVVSATALGQFGLRYWRALLAGVAAEPLSDRVLKVAGIAGQTIGAKDFGTLVSLHEMHPELGKDERGVLGVRIYYHLVAALCSLSRSIFPTLSSWAHREMATCSRYLAVSLDQRLGRNLACFAQIRSF